ncbi:MAG: hypothetical protein ACREO4_12625 [Lysobacter sp.]
MEQATASWDSTKSQTHITYLKPVMLASRLDAAPVASLCGDEDEEQGRADLLRDDRGHGRSGWCHEVHGKRGLQPMQ